MPQKPPRFLIAVFLCCVPLPGTAQRQSAPVTARADAASVGTCPSDSDLEPALRNSSELLEHGQFAQAAAALQPLAALHCDPQVSLLYAASLEGKGESPRAADTLEDAHSIWPADDRIAVSLAREYLAMSQPGRAAQALKSFKATDATPAKEIELAVVVFLTDHQLPSAEDLARLGYKLHPSAQSILLLANTLQLEGRYKDVIALLESKRSTYEGSAPFLVTLAESEYDAAVYDQARADAERAVSMQPNLYAAHYLLGNVQLKQGNPQAAASEYRTAIGIEPRQPRTYYYLALALRAQQDEKDEEGLLVKAITLNPQYAMAHCELGRILLNQNRLPDAVTQLNLAVEDNASSEQAYNLLARAYGRLGDTGKAQEAAKRLAMVRRANHQSATGPGTEPSGTGTAAHP